MHRFFMRRHPNNSVFFRFMRRLACLAACQSISLWAAPAPDTAKMEAPFPAGFLFGTATAGFQVDMGCPTISADLCEDRASDWYQFVTDPYFTKNPLLFIAKAPLRGGPGFFETYRDDLRLAHDQLGTNAMRVSIEWSRIFPEATFGIDGYDALRQKAAPMALDYYHHLFAAMHEFHIKPIVTLNHYSLPLWMHDGKHTRRNPARSGAKGWLDPRIVGEIAKYAGFVAREFGGEVNIWATLNEPFSGVVIPGFVIPSPSRSNPPGLFLHLGAAKLATVHMIEAHAAMYDAIHREDRLAADGLRQPAQVGLVNVYFAVDGIKGAKDQKAADDLRYFMNDMFMRPLLKGELDRYWDGRVEKRADLMGKLDYLGVNYYMRLSVKNGWVPGLKHISPFLHVDPLQSRPDADHPQGIYTVIASFKPYHLPILVTETGIDTSRDPAMVGNWLVRSLAYTRQAIADGHDVRGYLFWSLMDNYEWNHGFNQHFGLYALNPADPLKKRIPRQAVFQYRDILQANAIPHRLLLPFYGPKKHP